MQYMVCEVQYGGRITDSLDRELFNSYGQLWVTENIFQPQYSFNTTNQNDKSNDFTYHIPQDGEHTKFMDYINSMPEKDHPSIFGLNGNADMTHRLNESASMISTLIDTMPKESSGSGGKSREEEVKEKLETDLIKQLPANFVELDIEDQLKKLKGPRGINQTGKSVPLNVFLFQELQRFQRILDIVRRTMSDMVQAIDGTIIMTGDIVDSINAIYDFRVPKSW